MQLRPLLDETCISVDITPIRGAACAWCGYSLTSRKEQYLYDKADPLDARGAFLGFRHDPDRYWEYYLSCPVYTF